MNIVISSSWFPPKERITATSVAQVYFSINVVFSENAISISISICDQSPDLVDERLKESTYFGARLGLG